ncbi:MAG: hypothetical protein H6757_01385 [Candidatus Omnitrophica bacterium]|nr:hypothetical protein [Candidatus Omnitrophota bacterium]
MRKLPLSADLTKSSQKMLIQGLGILILLIVFFILIVLPKFRNVRILGRQVTEIASENVYIEKTVLKTKNSGQRLQTIQELLKKYQQMAPDIWNLSNVLENIASGAQADGLKVISMQALDDNMLEVKPGKSFEIDHHVINEVVIVMQAEGRYGAVAHYLKRLENAPYKISVKNMNMHLVKMDRASVFKEPVLTVEMKLGVLMSFDQSQN